MYTYQQFTNIHRAYTLAEVCEEIGVYCRYDKDCIVDIIYLQDYLQNAMENYAWDDMRDILRNLPDYGSDEDEYYNYDSWEAITEDDVDSAIEEAISEMHSHGIYLEGDPDTPKISEDADFDVVYRCSSPDDNSETFSKDDFNAILGGKTE